MSAYAASREQGLSCRGGSARMDVDAQPVFSGTERHEFPKLNGVGGRCGGFAALWYE